VITAARGTEFVAYTPGFHEVTGASPRLTLLAEVDAPRRPGVLRRRERPVLHDARRETAGSRQPEPWEEAKREWGEQAAGDDDEQVGGVNAGHAGSSRTAPGVYTPTHATEFLPQGPKPSRSGLRETQGSSERRVAAPSRCWAAASVLRLKLLTGGLGQDLVGGLGLVRAEQQKSPSPKSVELS
jgi:hypothetical protein